MGRWRDSKNTARLLTGLQRMLRNGLLPRLWIGRSTRPIGTQPRWSITWRSHRARIPNGNDCSRRRDDQSGAGVYPLRPLVRVSELMRVYGYAGSARNFQKRVEAAFTADCPGRFAAQPTRASFSTLGVYWVWVRPLQEGNRACMSAKSGKGTRLSPAPRGGRPP